MAQTFRLLPEGFRSRARSVVMSVSIVLAGALLVGVAPGLSAGGGNLPYTLLLTIAILVPAVGLGARSALRRQREIWQSMEFEVSGDAIVRRAAHHPEVVVRREAIRSIIEHPDGSLEIRGGGGDGDSIAVPSQLDRRGEFRALMAAWRPVEPAGPGASAQAVVLLGGLLGLLVMGATYLVDQPAIVVPAGVAVAVAMLASAYGIRRSPHLDVRIRRSWWLAVLPALGALLRVFEVLRQ